MALAKKNLICCVHNAGVQAYADALLVIPKTLAINSGFDPQETIVKLLEEARTSGVAVGLNLTTGQCTVVVWMKSGCIIYRGNEHSTVLTALTVGVIYM
jgi:chaperonin GroEL (HSP60 family)